MAKKIRCIVVDDSAVLRKMLTKLLESSGEIEVVAVAPDPYIARDKIVELKPDVMTLDVEMPRMDGITFLEKVMSHMPIRTVVISSLTQKGSETALRALAAGAIEVIEKPSLDVEAKLTQLGVEIVRVVKAVASARILPRLPIAPTGPVTKIQPSALAKTTHQVLAIASSTGGTEALKAVLGKLPPDIPGTLIVQHMPAGFTKTYAETLNRLCPFEVSEAVDGDKVIPGRVLIAPGNFHMELNRNGAFYNVKLHQEPQMHGVRPAADYLMKSVAKYAGANALGVVLTGMGKDGAEGLLEMKKGGSFNIAQNEETCVVYGMPAQAVAAGAIDKVLPLQNIANELVTQFKKRSV